MAPSIVYLRSNWHVLQRSADSFDTFCLVFFIWKSDTVVWTLPKV